MGKSTIKRGSYVPPSGPLDCQMARRLMIFATISRALCWQRGDSVVAVAERLGHENAALVLKVYGHLVEGSEDRSHAAGNLRRG